MNRRNFLLGGVAALAGTGYACIAEPRWLDNTETLVRIRASTKHQLRVVQLSDLHASFFVPLGMIDRAVKVAVAQRPDIICVTGDMITHQGGFDPAGYVRVLKQLSAVAPTFGILGNHDGGSWATQHHGYADHSIVDRLFEDSGIELLHNRHCRLEIRGQAVNVVGVGDLWSEELNAPRAFQGVRREIPTILLSHNPDSKDALGRFDWDLMLSGHTHGGQVIIPFDGPRFAPVVDKRYVAGLGQWNDRQIYVNRGVGNVGGVRFRCRPEVSTLHLDCG